MLRKSLIAMVILAGLLSILIYPKVYVLRASTEGTLYWNAQEALAFVEVSTSGAHMSYIRYALEPLLVSIGDVRQPDGERCSKILVIRVTDKDVQRYDTDLYRYAEDQYCGMHTALFGDQIYMGYLAHQDKIWKWSGTRFEAATQEELRGFDPVKIVSQHPWQFDDMNGWYMRGLGQAYAKYDLVLHGEPVTIVFHGKTWPPRPLSLELNRLGQSPQTIWAFDGRPHRVGKTEYERFFLTR